MLLPTWIARKIVKMSIKRAGRGESVNVPAIMRSIDALGDNDGVVEMSDVIDAISDYLSDAKDVLESIWDFLTDWI